MNRQLELFKLSRHPRYKLKPYWRAARRRVGAKSIEMAIISTYQRTGSLRATGAILGFSHVTIWEKLVLMGVPRGPRGGNNNPYGRSGKKKLKKESTFGE